MEGIVPQTGLLVEWSFRRGKLLKVSSKPRKSIQTFNSYITKTWNELPKAIRNLTGISTDSFKRSLDKYMASIEVHRRCPNDIKSVIKLQKEEKRRLGGSPILTKL